MKKLTFSSGLQFKASFEHGPYILQREETGRNHCHWLDHFDPLCEESVPKDILCFGTVETTCSCHATTVIGDVQRGIVSLGYGCHLWAHCLTVNFV